MDNRMDWCGLMEGKWEAEEQVHGLPVISTQ